jgi:hypothetical protein
MAMGRPTVGRCATVPHCRQEDPLAQLWRCRAPSKHCRAAHMDRRRAAFTPPRDRIPVGRAGGGAIFAADARRLRYTSGSCRGAPSTRNLDRSLRIARLPGTQRDHRRAQVYLSQYVTSCDPGSSPNRIDPTRFTEVELRRRSYFRSAAGRAPARRDLSMDGPDCLCCPRLQMG